MLPASQYKGLYYTRLLPHLRMNWEVTSLSATGVPFICLLPLPDKGPYESQWNPGLVFGLICSTLIEVQYISSVQLNFAHSKSKPGSISICIQVKEPIHNSANILNLHFLEALCCSAYTATYTVRNLSFFSFVLAS